MKTSFHDDARAWLAAELAEIDADVPAPDDPFKLACLYFNAALRTIFPARRTVHTSAVLRAKLASPTVDPTIVTAVREIVRRSQAGENLRPFQSTTVADARFQDQLLNDWGIQHLHVGALHEPRKVRRARMAKAGRRGHFIGGRNELLFAYVERADLYLIDLLDHGAFAEKGLLETMHREWPGVISRHVGRGLQGAPLIDGRREDVPAAKRKALRGKLNFMTTMDDGTVYLSPGGGFSATGMNMKVVMAADIFHASVERLEAWAHENEESLRSEIEKPGRIAGELNLRLSFDDESRAMLTEPTYRIGFRTDLRLRTTGHLVSVVSDVPLVA
jgi:hypothetical protein